MVRRLQDDVDDAGDGVRAVLGGGPVGEHLDVVDRPDRDQAEVHRRRSGVGIAAVDGEVRGGVAALAIDQHQRVVGVEPAQGGLDGQGRRIGAILLKVERRHALLQHVLQVGLAHMLDGLGAHHLDRLGAIGRLHPDLTRAGDDHLGHRVRPARAIGGAARVLRRSRQGRKEGDRTGSASKLNHQLTPLGDTN